MDDPIDKDFIKVLPQLLMKFEASAAFSDLGKKLLYQKVVECFRDRTLMAAEDRQKRRAATHLADAVNKEESTARGYAFKLKRAIHSYHKGEGKDEPLKFSVRERGYFFARLVPDAAKSDGSLLTYDAIAGNPIDPREFLRLMTALSEQQQLDQRERANLFEAWVNNFGNKNSPLWGIANRIMSDAKESERRATYVWERCQNEVALCVRQEERLLDELQKKNEPALRDVLRPLLEDYRRDTEKAQKAQEHAQREMELARSTGGFEAFIANLAARQDRGSAALTVGDLGELAKLFRVNPLLLLPLCSIPINESHVELDFTTFIKGPFTKTGAGAGPKTEYSTPPFRLAETDAAFILLRLHPGGGSSSHEHPGDELVYVRSGRVEFGFEHTGVVAPLQAGDLIHFYAEDRHFARVPEEEEESELLIVRFYQLDRRATRQALAFELETALGSKDPLSEDAALWIRQLAPPTRVGVTTYDNLGLSRFLSDWKAAELGSAVLEESDNSALLLRSAFTNRDLDSLAAARGIEPYLLYHYAMSAQPSPVIIRDQDYKMFSPLGNSGAEYLIPKRNLSCSDISIAKVRLRGIGSSGESGNVTLTSTTFNRHPGYEVIFVTQGAVRLYYEGVEKPIAVASANGPSLCHFDSTVSHRVCNDSLEKIAEYFVIRFYRDGRYAAGSKPYS